MIGSLGVPEILFIFVLALLVFGPKRLPEIGRMVGKGMAEFRKASNELKRTINAEIALEEDEAARQRRSLSAVPGGAETAATASAAAVEATVPRNPYMSFGPDVIITPAPRSEEDEAYDEAEDEAYVDGGHGEDHAQPVVAGPIEPR
jgi:TatA/E family protein of Tat protein translocase